MVTIPGSSSTTSIVLVGILLGLLLVALSRSHYITIILGILGLIGPGRRWCCIRTPLPMSWTLAGLRALCRLCWGHWRRWRHWLSAPRSRSWAVSTGVAPAPPTAPAEEAKDKEQ